MSTKTKTIITRADHYCSLCAKTIPAGSRCLAHKYIYEHEDGLDHGTYWTHRKCQIRDDRKRKRLEWLVKRCHHPSTYIVYGCNEPLYDECYVCGSKVTS